MQNDSQKTDLEYLSYYWGQTPEYLAKMLGYVIIRNDYGYFPELGMRVKEVDGILSISYLGEVTMVHKDISSIVNYLQSVFDKLNVDNKFVEAIDKHIGSTE